MSTLKQAASIHAHGVHTGVAHLIESHYRFKKWAHRRLMGTDMTPVCPFSCPEADGVFELAYDSSTGLITTDAYDLECVAESRICNPHHDHHGHHHHGNHHGPCHEHNCNHNHGHYNYVHHHLGHLVHGHYDHGHHNAIAHTHSHDHHHGGHGHGCGHGGGHCGDHGGCHDDWHHGHHHDHHHGHHHGWHNDDGKHAWHDDHSHHDWNCHSCGKHRDHCKCHGGHHHHSHVGEVVKSVTIECPNEVRDCRKVIYLTNSTEEDPDDPSTSIPVQIHLTNNGHPAPGPHHYLLAPGDLRYLIIEYGRIVSIEN